MGLSFCQLHARDGFGGAQGHAQDPRQGERQIGPQGGSYAVARNSANPPQQHGLIFLFIPSFSCPLLGSGAMPRDASISLQGDGNASYKAHACSCHFSRDPVSH